MILRNQKPAEQVGIKLAPLWTAGTSLTSRALTILSAGGFLLAYVGLDWLSYVNPIGNLNITPWNPPPALSIALVLNVGWPGLPLTILGPWLSDIVVRGADPSNPLSICTATVIGLGYSLAAMAIGRQQAARDPRQVSSIAVLLIISAAAALLVGATYSLVMVSSGALQRDQFLMATVTQWIGDTNGIVVVLPLLVLASTPGRIKWPRTTREFTILLAQYLVLAVALWIIFSPPSTDDFQYFFLLFLPAIWIPLRWGVDMTAVSMALLEAALVAIMIGTPYPPAYFLEFQMRMVVLTVTSLLLAAVVSERIRSARTVREKDDELAGLARLLAVGEMTSAIAHEINNPVTALRNYLRAARLMANAVPVDGLALVATLDRAVTEAERTSDVVRRLRDFYRTGNVHRQAFDAHRLVSECVNSVSDRLKRQSVSTSVLAPAGLPQAWADPLQLSIVLQNLLSNAGDAMTSVERVARTISVQLGEHDGMIEICVCDTGEGVVPELANHLFEPFKSTKAGGMGLGLAISRSLVEANGGRIWLARNDLEGVCVAFSVPSGTGHRGGAAS